MKNNIHTFAILFQRLIARSFFLCLFLIVGYSTVGAYDTFWHSSACEEVGAQYGFSANAIKALQMGSFSTDYFGPIFSALESNVEKISKYVVFRNAVSTSATRAASNFMHFDNLSAKLDRNWKFDYVWSRLLENTQNTIAAYYNNPKLTEEERKILILLTLGSSLHMVEDFYSHSDWIHFDFVKMGFPQQKSSDGSDRAPTWFEVRNKFGHPSATDINENWHFHVSSGIYPPKDNAPLSSLGVPLSHTTMNHDNSQLYYDMASQIKYHNFGAHPAHDSATASQHQFFAYQTASAASVEWIALLENLPNVRTAIEFARNWGADKLNSHVEDDLEDGLSSIRLASCTMQKWDGNHPPPERANDCSTGKLLSHLHIPKMSNVFWGSFPKDSILQKLTYGYSDTTGNYTFDSLRIRRAR